MKIAILQMSSVAGDPEANIARIATAAAQAAMAGASLLVTPELAVSGYGSGEALLAQAETRAGMEARLGEMARHNGLAIAAGFAEREGGRLFNSVLLTDGRALAALYRKSHLYGGYERALFAPEPPSTVIAEAFGLKIAPLICYDVEFPENVRRLAKAGVDLVVVPTALPESAASRFIAEHVVKVRAFENHVFIAYADQHGSDGRFRYAGLSTLAAPDGSVLAQAPAEGDSLLVADIRPGDFRGATLENDYLADLDGLAS